MEHINQAQRQELAEHIALAAMMLASVSPQLEYLLELVDKNVIKSDPVEIAEQKEFHKLLKPIIKNCKKFNVFVYSKPE